MLYFRCILSECILFALSSEFLGDPNRNIKVPGSFLVKARQKTQPKYAARYLVRALFSKEALLSSAVGTGVQGLMALDANKVVAIRGNVNQIIVEFLLLIMIEHRADSRKVEASC